MSLLNSRTWNVAATLAAAASMSFAVQAQKAASTLVAGTSLSEASVPPLAAHPVLTQHVPQLVSSGHASRLAALEASEPLQLTLSLPLRNQDALNTLLANLYNPASPSYHQWLQPAQFDAQFGPAAADYQTVISWARANGFDIVAKSSNNRVLTIQGSTGLVNRAFHVTETTYHDSVRNRDFRAPDREPTTDLSVPLLAVSGLETSNPRTNFHEKAPAAAEKLPASISLRAPEPKPSATGSGPSGTFLPSDMRAAYYGVTGAGALTGAGQSVAIYSYDSYLASDVALWYSTTGVTPSTIPVTNKVIAGFSGGSCPGTSCDDGEQVLDILQVQGMAPGLSHIYFYESDSAVSELNQMVSDDLAAVITSSWSGGDFGPACDPSFLQMAAQGQTYLNATGDSGGFNPFTYLPPGLDPYIVEVGGTDLTTASAGGAWSSETAWADSGGGFFDVNIPIPTWQTASGIITSTNKGSTAYRNSPDIGAEANFDNSLVSNGSFETGYGGTSYATPRMAGYLALANQQSVAAGTGTLGFINPTLYDLGLRSTAASTYHDTTSGSAPSSTSYNGARTTYSAVAGYDLVTGWGSPNGPGLLNALTGPNFSLAANTNALTIALNASSSVNFTVTPVNNFTGTPTFAVTGLPTGVSGTVSPAGTNTYSLPLTVSSGATIGTATVTVTATYGSLVKTTTFALTVAKRAGYDFTISATNAMVTQMSFANSIVTVQDGAGYSGPVDLSVSNLPAGVTVQFGTPSTFSKSNLTFFASIASAPGTYTVLLTGTAAGIVIHSVPVTLTILPVPSALADGGFEATSSPWVFTSSLGGGYLCNESCGLYQRSGSNFGYLNGFGEADTDVLSQTFTIPVANKATLNFWLWIATAETSTTAKNDNLTVTVTNAAGVSTTVATYSNLNHTNGYALYSYDLTAFEGQTVTLQFTGVENASRSTAFLLDDISVVTQ